MRKWLMIIALAFGKFISAQEEGVENYDEFAGWNVDGMAGIQFGIHPGNVNIPMYVFGAHPRYNFYAPKEWFSISAGGVPQVGMDVFLTNSGSIFQFAADLPAVLDINLGARSTTFNENWFGGYVGGGLDYNFTYAYYDGAKFNSHAFGPMAHIGFRWTYMGRPVGFRAAYMWGLVNNFEQDPSLIYEGNTYPTFLSLNILYGIR